MTTAEPTQPHQPPDELADSPETAAGEEAGSEPTGPGWLDPQSRLAQSLGPFLQCVDGVLSKIGDRLNSILFKEA